MTFLFPAHFAHNLIDKRLKEDHQHASECNIPNSRHLEHTKPRTTIHNQRVQARYYVTGIDDCSFVVADVARLREITLTFPEVLRHRLQWSL